MPVSDAQKRANAKYRKEKMKQVTVRFSPNELDVYEFLKSQDNASGFIKRIIRDAMPKG